jgi:hypothetical protein
MFQTPSYKILSQEGIEVDENENDFSSSESSNESQESLDLILISTGKNKLPKRKKLRDYKNTRMGRIDRFDHVGADSYQVSDFFCSKKC